MTSTFRDYNAGNPEFGEFSLRTTTRRNPISILDTNGRAVFTQTWLDGTGERMVARAIFTRDQARRLGLALIGMTGQEWAFMLAAREEFKGEGGSLWLDVVDGYPSLRCYPTAPEFEAWPSEEDSDPGELTHDMGMRLIVWAGVA